MLQSQWSTTSTQGLGSQLTCTSHNIAERMQIWYKHSHVRFSLFPSELNDLESLERLQKYSKKRIPPASLLLFSKTEDSVEASFEPSMESKDWLVLGKQGSQSHSPDTCSREPDHSLSERTFEHIHQAHRSMKVYKLEEIKWY